MASKLTDVGRKHRRVQVLADGLGRANTHFYYFEQLQDAGKEFGDEMCRSGDFWGYTIGAHLQAAILQLCRVYDKRGDCLHLFKFLNEDVSGRMLSEPEKKQFQKDLKFCDPNSKAPPVERVRKWRHNLIAHCNYELALSDLQDVWKQYPFKREHIRMLIDEGFAILERWTMLDDEEIAILKKLRVLDIRRRTFKRHVQGKEKYRFVLESLRANDQQSKLSKSPKAEET